MDSEAAYGELYNPAGRTVLWREYFGERAVMVNDDKPLLHIEAARVAYEGMNRLKKQEES